MEKSVFIFRGGPASGKGTIAPEFCKLLPKPVALIEQDSLRWGFHLIGREVADVSDEEHEFANRNTELLYERYLQNGRYNIVLEGLFTWDDENSSQGCAKRLVNLAQKYGYGVTSIVIKADKDELIERNSQREYIVPDAEFDELYDNTYQTIDAGEVVIDSTGKSVEETLDLLKPLVK